jgi:hypothetical protein
MTVERWEDVIPAWKDPGYGDHALSFHPSVKRRQIGGAIITCVEVLDWDGNGGRDLLISAWDACYGGCVRLFEESGRRPDGTPELTDSGVVEGVSGFVTVIPDGETFHLLSTSRLRRELHLYVNQGEPGDPRFGAPIVLSLEADWLREGELFHLARFHDIDGDGHMELVLGTDFWLDYWPDGKEWNVEGYRPYSPEGRWRGGPLRGNLYVFRNEGTPTEPQLGHGTALSSGDLPIETYGQLCPTFGDFRGIGRDDLICGSFRDDLYFFSRDDDGSFTDCGMLRRKSGVLKLPHCIQFPTAVDWNGNGRIDLLVGAEDGRVWFLRNAGTREKEPIFDQPVPVHCANAPLRVGALPVPATADWTGKGRIDVIAGNSAGELLFLADRGETNRPALGPVRPVFAGGRRVRVAAGLKGSIQGPSEYKFGYTCPTAADWDGDGRPDLLVSDVLGRHLFYRNLGGDPPRFDAPQPLMFEGRPLITVWRVRPAVVDWQDDGCLSYVTLDEDGVLATYERLSDRDLGAKRLLTYADGTPIRFTEDAGGGLGRIKLCVGDWTGNGRPDILFGTHNRASVPPDQNGMPRHTTYQAGVFILENVGDEGTVPRFAAARPFRYRDAPLVFGMHACSPEIVNWRPSEGPDLLVGVEDGSLLWFPRDQISW